MWKCPNCGVVNSDSRRCNYCKSPAPEQVKSPGVSDWTASEWYRFLRLFLGGLGCVALGVWLMVDPTFRSDPKHFTSSDLLPGLGATFVGIVLLGLVLLPLILRRRQ